MAMLFPTCKNSSCAQANPQFKFLHPAADACLQDGICPQHLQIALQNAHCVGQGVCFSLLYCWGWHRRQNKMEATSSGTHKSQNLEL